MEIEKLNIHSYGKIKDKEIKFRNHINIIFGKNESGKSTIMHYIVNSLYGISKNKKSKELSDVSWTLYYFSHCRIIAKYADLSW